MTRAERIEAAARALLDRVSWSPDLLAYTIDRHSALSDLRSALLSPPLEGEPRTLRDRVQEPGFGATVAALVAAGSVKCKCGRDADEHFIFEEDIGVTICDGFAADLSLPGGRP